MKYIKVCGHKGTKYEKGQRVLLQENLCILALSITIKETVLYFSLCRRRFWNIAVWIYPDITR